MYTGPMVTLALPGMIMLEAEYLAFEILTLASGQFGTTELAAQSILVTISSTTYQIPFPMSIAASTRVANLIGAKLPAAAKVTAKVVSTFLFLKSASWATLPRLTKLWSQGIRYWVLHRFK